MPKKLTPQDIEVDAYYLNQRSEAEHFTEEMRRTKHQLSGFSAEELDEADAYIAEQEALLEERK